MSFDYLDYNSELRVRAVFPANNWLAACLAAKPFMPGCLCQHEGKDGLGCPALATCRILVNIWGTVAEYETCDEHASYHGQLLDDFPLRKFT